MWLLVIVTKTIPVVHSFHKEEHVARMWGDCKVSDGEDVLVISLPKDVLDDIIASKE